MLRDDSTSPIDIEQRAHELIEDRADEYESLDAWDSTVDGMFLARCSDCKTWMHLGEGWQGCSLPTCPDCNDSADSWADDPTISESRALELASDKRNFKQLVTG